MIYLCIEKLVTNGDEMLNASSNHTVLYDFIQ